MPRTPGDPAIREALAELLEEQLAYHADQAELHARLHGRTRHQLQQLAAGRVPRVLRLNYYARCREEMRQRLSSGGKDAA